MRRNFPQPMPNALVLPFPIRPKHLAQIVIPRDLTKAEAGRLCAFVMSLAAPARAAASLQETNGEA